MNHITVYARKETTQDSDVFKYGNKLDPLKDRYKDIQIYKDKLAQIPFARFMWYQHKPTKRNKWINLNCFKYRLEWI